jgi:hypothetical protein
MVLRVVSRLLPAFKDKSQLLKELVIQSFTRSAGLTQCSATHMVQKHFLETEANAKDFMAMIRDMRDKIDGRNLDNIINMDQTLIAFSYHPNKMLDVKGTKTIHTRMSTSDTKRITLAATVTASGNMLPPNLIFKGKPNGCIASWEFLTFPAVRKYACQDKAWMNEGMMHKWIDVVLLPWKEMQDLNQPCHQPPILILDAYHVHQMGSVVNQIQSMGIDVIHIPAGCTSLCQPIDIGINKLIKT